MYRLCLARLINPLPFTDTDIYPSARGRFSNIPMETIDPLVDAMRKIADERGVSVSAIAINWVMSKGPSTSSFSSLLGLVSLTQLLDCHFSCFAGAIPLGPFSPVSSNPSSPRRMADISSSWPLSHLGGAKNAGQAKQVRSPPYNSHDCPDARLSCSPYRHVLLTPSPTRHRTPKVSLSSAFAHLCFPVHLMLSQPNISSVVSPQRSGSASPKKRSSGLSRWERRERRTSTYPFAPPCNSSESNRRSLTFFPSLARALGWDRGCDRSFWQHG